MSGELPFDGLTAVVVSADAAVAASLALDLGVAGAKVVLHHSREETGDRLQMIVDRIEYVDGEAVLVRCDLAGPDAMSTPFDRAAGRFGGIDIALLCLRPVAVSVCDTTACDCPDLEADELAMVESYLAEALLRVGDDGTIAVVVPLIGSHSDGVEPGNNETVVRLLSIIRSAAAFAPDRGVNANLIVVLPDNGGDDVSANAPSGDCGSKASIRQHSSASLLATMATVARPCTGQVLLTRIPSSLM